MLSLRSNESGRCSREKRGAGMRKRAGNDQDLSIELLLLTTLLQKAILYHLNV
jgi:hypothetical protein